MINTCNVINIIVAIFDILRAYHESGAATITKNVAAFMYVGEYCCPPQKYIFTYNAMDDIIKLKTKAAVSNSEDILFRIAPS